MNLGIVVTIVILVILLFIIISNIKIVPQAHAYILDVERRAAF